MRLGWKCFDQTVRQQDIQHRRLINNNKLLRKWSMLVVSKVIIAGLKLQKAVKRARRTPGCLSHTLGRATCGRRQRVRYLMRIQDIEECPYSRRLSDTRSTGQDGDFRAVGQAY